MSCCVASTCVAAQCCHTFATLSVVFAGGSDCNASPQQRHMVALAAPVFWALLVVSRTGFCRCQAPPTPCQLVPSGPQSLSMVCSAEQHCHQPGLAETARLSLGLGQRHCSTSIGNLSCLAVHKLSGCWTANNGPFLTCPSVSLATACPLRCPTVQAPGDQPVYGAKCCWVTRTTASLGWHGRRLRCWQQSGSDSQQSRGS